MLSGTEGTKEQIMRILMIATVLLAAFSANVFGQTSDPRSAPFPVLDSADPQKSVVVELRFDDRFDVTTESVRVVPERTRVRAGDPPLLQVDVMNLEGEVIETFNAWHPQWVFVEGEGGGESRIVEPGAVGSILCPFTAAAAEMRITDVAAATEVAVVDVLPGVHDFCRENPQDPDCASVANRPPVCDPGGPYVAECRVPLALDASASFDPDGDAFTFDWAGTFVEGTATEAQPTVTFAQPGANLADLGLMDEFGGSSVCSAEVTVVDTTLPTVDCNAAPTFPRPHPAVTFQALAEDSCDGAAAPVITGFRCYKTNPNGKEIDATGHCRVELEGDRIHIRGVGLPQVTVEWTVAATDLSGNTATTVCASTAEHPAGP
jgi:hypothetical protein